MFIGKIRAKRRQCAGMPTILFLFFGNRILPADRQGCPSRKNDGKAGFRQASACSLRREIRWERIVVYRAAFLARFHDSFQLAHDFIFSALHKASAARHRFFLKAKSLPLAVFLHAHHQRRIGLGGVILMQGECFWKMARNAAIPAENESAARICY